jgi:hypothetical protein
MRVRTGRFRSGGQGFPPPHDMTRWPRPRHPMLPIGAALISDLAHTGVIGADIRSAVGCQPTSSALHPSSSLPVSSFQRACSRPRLAARLLWPRLTSHGISSVGSPQVRTRCSPAQPPHLPPRANQSISLCGASSSRRVGLRCGSCSSARSFPIAFLPPVGCPSGVGFW